MVDIVDSIFNIVWVGYLFCAFKASFNYFQKPLGSHHIYNIKINLAYYMILIRNSIHFFYNIIHYTYYLQMSHLSNYLIYTVDFIYLTTTNIIYYIQSLIHILNMIYMDTVNVYYHIQPVIYPNNSPLITTDNIFYLH